MPKPIDPRSDELVLVFTGATAPSDVPARDLHGGDLARIAYVRQTTALAATPPPHPPPTTPRAALPTERSNLGACPRPRPPRAPAQPPQPPAPPAEPEA